MAPTTTVHLPNSAELNEPSSLLAVVPLEELQHLQDSLADIHNVTFLITDPDGNLLTMPSNEMSTCRLFHRSPQAEALCFAAMQRMAAAVKVDRQAVHQGKCPLGFLCAVAPILLDDTHTADLWIRKPCILQDQAEALDASLFPRLDSQRLLSEMASLERCDENDIDTIMAWLTDFAKQIHQLAHKNLALTRNVGMLHRLENELDVYKAQMEELVNERTADLIGANKRLQLEMLERDLAEEQIARKSKLIDAINQVLQQTLAEFSEQKLLLTFLQAGREITQSAFGFIVERQGDVWALSALSPRVRDSRGNLQSHPREDFNISGVWQEVIDRKDAVVVRSPMDRSDWQPLRGYFPAIENLLAVPLVKDGQASGLVALVNNDQGYSLVDCEDIKALAQAFMGALVRKRMEIAKYQSEKRLNLAMDSANQGLWDFFPRSGHLYFSPSWFTMLGYHAHEFPTSMETWTTLTHPNDVVTLETALASVAEGETPSFSIEIRMLGKEGHWRWINTRGRMVESDDEKGVIRVVGTLIDISKYKRIEMALQKANEELQRLAALDDLTQIANRRRFDDRLSQEWRRARRESRPLALIICDIDFFKDYNDTYGHLKGDDTLHVVAQTLSDMLKRPMDLVARYGGEEFAAILPNTNIKGAMRVANEFKTAIDTLMIAHQGSSASDHITLSFGVAAIIPGSDMQPKALIEAADKALYRAKAMGRNTIVKAPGAQAESSAPSESAA